MNRKITHWLVALTIVANIAPGAVFAQTASTSANATAIADLLRQIQLLNQQISNLKTQTQQVRSQRKEAVSTLLTALREGSQGDKVAMLQALLAADPTIYPEGLISGFYGRLTAAAVKRFQKKHGLAQVGFVGPKTLQKLNEFLEQNPVALEDDDDDDRDHEGKGIGVSKRVCAKVPPGHLVAPGWLRKHDGERPIVPLCQNLPPGIIKQLPTSTTPTSTTDVTAPVIANVGASVGPTSVLVSWTTNEPADTQMAYGTSTAYGLTTALGPLFLINHSQGISGLSTVTTYHYQVRSKDPAGNLATSTDQSFTTAAGDTTAPVISSVGVIASSTQATVVWTTNEPSTSKVYFGTSSTVDTAATSTPSVSTSTLVTSHSVDLMSLATSTTYYLVVESADGFGNTSTSSASFATATST